MLAEYLLNMAADFTVGRLVAAVLLGNYMYLIFPAGGF